MTNEEKYLIDKWEIEWNNKILFMNKKIIIIDKENNRSYLVYCKNINDITILKKSKKYKKIISQFKNLFPEINFNTSKEYPFKFIHFFEDIPKNEIIIGINNNKLICGGFGVYEI